MSTYRTNRRLLLLAVLLLVFAESAFAGPNAGAVVSLDLIPDGGDGNRACPGDFDNNGIVEFEDFLSFVAVYGTSSGDANYNALMDMDGNGVIDFRDFLLFAGVFGTTCEQTPPQGGDTISDRNALIALYNATDGPNWKNKTNWLSDRSLGEWYGVTTDANGRVILLYLHSNQLTGSIPDELGSLSNLQELVLNSNQLTGPIPDELGSLSSLQSLLLHANDALSGLLPASFTALDSLKQLFLHDTQLCAPTDAAFQAWLEGIENKQGVVNCDDGDGDAEPPPPPPVVDRVTVSPSSPSIEKGETQQFTASAYDSDNEIISGKTFNWSSSNTLVATISASGLARGVSGGSTTITASVDGKSGTATLTVTEPPPPPPVVDRVTVSPSSPSIEKGETQQFTASAYDSDNEIISGKTFNWSSSNASVATISASGLARGVSGGSTTITASVDGKSGTTTLTVTEPPPPPPVVDRVTVSPSSPSIEKGETQQFTASAYDSDNEIISGKTFNWSSSNTLVATISASGLARGVSGGSTTITASVDGKSGTTTLTVTEPPPPPPVVDRVTVSPSSPSIEKGETQQFTASAYDSDNEIISGKTFNWSSSNTLVATISASGLARGVSAGSTTITASVDGKSGTTTLTVTEPPPPPPVVDRVTVSPSSPSIEKGETQQFTASAYDSDNEIISGKTFNWSSSNTLVATISASGLATGVGAGSTTITASVDGKSGTTTLTVTEPPPPPPVVDRVTVSPSSPSIEKGETQQFTASAYDSDNEIISGKTFNWSSSNILVATVSASGLATGVGAGSTTIKASVDGKSGTTTLTVTEPPPPPPVVDRVTVSPSSPSIEKGETQQFTASAYDSDNEIISGKTFNWSSSNALVATISASGLARGVSGGSTTITASVDGKSGTTTLTVTEPPPPPPVVDRVTVSPSSPSIEKGETQQFTASAYDSDNEIISGKTFDWSSSNPSAATISASGLATGVGAGSTTITASVDGKSGTATLTVTEPPPMLRSRTGTINGRNNYSAGGSVTLSEVAGGRLRLSITGLSTPGGAPDVYVALYTSSDINWPNGGSLPDGAEEFGEVSRQSGNKEWTFTPASGKDIDSWSHLILHCRLINSEVGSASLSN